MSKNGITRLLFEEKNNTNEKNFTPTRIFDASLGNQNSILDSVEQEKQRAFKQGYQEGVEQAANEWNTKLDLIKNMSHVLDDSIQDIDKTIQEKCAEIAIAISKQIIRRELSLDSGQIVSAVKQAIDLIPRDGERINIHINPKDMQYINEIFSSEDQTSKYNIVQDPSIDAGGCKAFTDYSLVDLTIDKQIASIALQIFGEQRNDAR